MWMHADATIHGASKLELEPSELCGFGLGEWQVVEKSKLDSKNGLVWQFSDDLDYILLGEQRLLTPLCDAVYTSMMENNLPGVAPQYHSANPLTTTQEAGNLISAIVSVLWVLRNSRNILCLASPIALFISMCYLNSLP